MEIEVLIFGAAAVRAKTDRVTVVVRDRPTVRNVLAVLHEQHSALRFALPPLQSARLAVNHTFAHADHEISAADEVALVTLVSGG